MASSTHIPKSPACGHWETLLADALDGLLRPEDEATFSSHMATCPACTILFEESRRGREWLEFLSAEPEIPEGLLDKILASTGPGQVAGYGLVTSEGPALPLLQPWQRPGMMGRVRRFAEPRLMMTAAMAFFSIALTLNLTGVRLNDLKLSNLRPATIRSFVERRFTMASTPIVRYYAHLRLVYEVQARIRELRRNAQPEGSENRPQSNPQQPAPGESKQNPPRKDGGSRVDPPQQSGVPAVNDFNDYLETSLILNQQPFAAAEETSCRATVHSPGNKRLPGIPAQFGGFFIQRRERVVLPQESKADLWGSRVDEGPSSASARFERSTVWTA